MRACACVCVRVRACGERRKQTEEVEESIEGGMGGKERCGVSCLGRRGKKKEGERRGKEGIMEGRGGE